MPNYRRVRIYGGTYFFTLTTFKRREIFLKSDARTIFLEAIKHVMEFHPFSNEAYCILPDHIHLLWRMPEDDADYSLRISEIKKRFSMSFQAKYPYIVIRDESQLKRKESGVWQRRFWEHYIRDENDLRNHIDYIHYNPVKHGLVRQVKDWPSSSFFDYVRLGHYEVDWGDSYQPIDNKLHLGE